MWNVHFLSTGLPARVAICAAFFALSAPALAQSSGDGMLQSLVPARDGAKACFQRSYDAKHLAEHPRQRVTDMQFRLTHYVHEPDEYAPEGQRNYYFELRARLRGMKRGEELVAGGECMVSRDERAIFCGVECDGGGVLIRPRGNGRILVDLEAMGRIRMTPECGGDDEEDAVELTSGEDDRSFLLSRQADAACPAYEDW